MEQLGVDRVILLCECADGELPAVDAPESLPEVAFYAPGLCSDKH